MASTYLSRTNSSANQQTFTISCWVKSSADPNQTNGVWSAGVFDNGFEMYFDSRFKFRYYTAASYANGDLVTDGSYRDCSGWYHWVCVADTTNATAGDRLRMYINGERITSFLSELYPSLNYNYAQVANNTVNVGWYNQLAGSTYFLSGSLAHYHYCDGYAYQASDFGEYSATSGVWKPKTAPSVSYGTNGFFLKFANAGSLGTDSSGNGNNLTVNGTGTQTLDNPSNNFATMNPLDNYYFGGTFTNGNNTVACYSGSGVVTYCTSTMGVGKGKWYIESKYVSSTAGDYSRFGIGYKPSNSVSDNLGNETGEAVYRPDGSILVNNTETLSWGSSWTTGDIISIALDCDNSKLYFGKNGVWQNSADPSAGTGGISITDVATLGNYFFGWGDNDGGSGTAVWSYNFGNGYFGTTAVSTPESDGDGFGKFEYAVPTGYYSLCTKNIITYG